MTPGRWWLQFGTGCTMVFIQFVRVCIDIHVIHHYTTWNFALVGLLLISASFQALDYWTALYLQPLTLVATPFVVMATAIMFALDFGVVEDSFHSYPAAVVHLANLVLHGLPFAICVTVAIFSLEYYHVRLRETCWSSSEGYAYIFIVASMAFVYSASYFYTFSPQIEYKFTTNISNYTARKVSVLFHTIGAGLTATAFMFYYKLQHATLTSRKSI
jgi:hypothetical protein